MSQLTWYILEIILLIILFVIILRYILSYRTDKGYMPVSWKQSLKKKEISPILIRAERRFKDKGRFMNLWLQINRIKKDKIPGSFAELGVYQGETAHVIHHCDPEREFYLFDTFTGFTGNDLQEEIGEASTYTTRNFADTTIDKVKRTIDGNDNLVFVQGYFPDSAKGLKNKNYAFVNIDADLYKPILAGLRYFYPLLSSGGVILVHDYNQKWPGAMKAVDEFVRTIPEVIIPVPDSDNTIMIIKNKSV